MEINGTGKKRIWYLDPIMGIQRLARGRTQKTGTKLGQILANSRTNRSGNLKNIR
jgi:hypothetical protein